MDDEILPGLREIDRAAKVQTSAQPISDAIRDIPHNELLVEGRVTKAAGGELHGSIERDLVNGVSFGVEGGRLLPEALEIGRTDGAVAPARAR
jgi:hypothetical protein